MIVADAHARLSAARRSTLPSVSWQRCQFHLQQNAQSYVTRLDQRKPVAQRIRSIFNAPDKTEAERLLRQAIEGWRTEAPKLAEWAEKIYPRASLQSIGRWHNASGYALPMASFEVGIKKWSELVPHQGRLHDFDYPKKLHN